MIHPSHRWQFVSHIVDLGYYEDDVVRHIGMGHSALRRSYSEKFWEDKVAREEVTAQMVRAAACNPPALPRIFAHEVVKGFGTFVMEHIEGKPLEELINEGVFKREREWAGFASQLTNELLAVRAAGGRFERLTTAHIVVIDSTDIRITQRWSLGSVSAERAQQSPFLQRMLLQKHGGVYVCQQPPHEPEELLALREILTQMAAGTSKATYDGLRAPVISEPELHPNSLLAGIEQPIAQAICALDPKVGGIEHQLHLEALQDSLERQYRAAIAKKVLADEEQPSGAQPAKPRQGEFYVPPRVTLVKVSAETRGEASSLYQDAVPDKPREEKKPAKKALVLAPANVTAIAKPVQANLGAPRRPGFFAVHGMKVLVVAGILAVIAVLVVVAPMLMPKQSNQQPTAMLKPPFTTNVPLSSKLILDATESSDPDGDSLSYYWELLTPGASLFFSRPDGTQVRENTFSDTLPQVQVQFMSPGEAVIQLRVFDGVRYSDALTASFTVSSN